MLYRLTEQGKEIFKEIEQGRSHTAYNPNLAIALQTVIDVAEEGLVSDTVIQAKTHMPLETVNQLMDTLLLLKLIEPVKPSKSTPAGYGAFRHEQDALRSARHGRP